MAGKLGIRAGPRSGVGSCGKRRTAYTAYTRLEQTYQLYATEFANEKYIPINL
jgi:hypothetical protein